MQFRSRSSSLASNTMAATIIYDGKVSQVAGASAQANDLWITPTDLSTITGWELKPQGLCRDDVCVPIPAGRESELLGGDNRVNLAAIARLLGQPTVHDDVNAVWFFGEPVAKRLAHDGIVVVGGCPEPRG